MIFYNQKKKNDITYLIDGDHMASSSFSIDSLYTFSTQLLITWLENLRTFFFLSSKELSIKIIKKELSLFSSFASLSNSVKQLYFKLVLVSSKSLENFSVRTH